MFHNDSQVCLSVRPSATVWPFQRQQINMEIHLYNLVFENVLS